MVKIHNQGHPAVDGVAVGQLLVSAVDGGADG